MRPTPGLAGEDRSIVAPTKSSAQMPAKTGAKTDDEERIDGLQDAGRHVDAEHVPIGVPLGEEQG